MIFENDIRRILKPAGLDNSPDCVEAFLYFARKVATDLASVLEESDVLDLLAKAALQLKSRAGNSREISSAVLFAIFQETFKESFQKFESDSGLDPEDFMFGPKGPAFRATLVLTSAPLDLSPIARTETQIAHGRDLAEAAKRFKGCFYWAGPSGLDSGGKLETSTQRKPGTIHLTSPTSVKVFQSLGMMTPSGEPHHPVGGKIIQDVDRSFVEGNPNDFTPWLLGGGDVTTEFRCNCWEAVLICAWSARLLKRSALRELYQSAMSAPRTPKADFSTNLLNIVFQFQRSEVLLDRVHPHEGDIIFFNGPAHVAVATGHARQVMSLWHQEDSAFVEISIDILSAEVGHSPEVRFVPCPF